MQETDKFSKELSAIRNNMEKYMSFGIGKPQIIDGFYFMSNSLEKLYKNLSISDKHYLASTFQDALNYSEEKMCILTII